MGLRGWIGRWAWEDDIDWVEWVYWNAAECYISKTCQVTLCYRTASYMIHIRLIHQRKTSSHANDVITVSICTRCRRGISCGRNCGTIEDVLQLLDHTFHSPQIRLYPSDCFLFLVRRLEFDRKFSHERVPVEIVHRQAMSCKQDGPVRNKTKEPDGFAHPFSFQ